MLAATAQSYIDQLAAYTAPSEEAYQAVQHLKVDYQSIEQMPNYKRGKLAYCIQYIIERYDPPYIDLVKSQLDGYPIDERTTPREFELLKRIGKNKFSDWDFIVPTITRFQVIETIAPLIKLDLFQYHHGGVRKLRVYAKEML